MDFHHSSKKILSVLEKLERESTIEQNSPGKKDKNDLMLAITKDTGKFLNILTTMINAKNILEIGTSTGYSTLWLALSLNDCNDNKNPTLEGKRLLTIENDPKKIKRAIRNFEEADVLDIIHIVEQNALDFLEKISNEFNLSPNKKNQPFDIIFLDADKENLIKYFDLSLSILRKGGIIVTDNILFPEEYRETMSEYTKHIRNINSVVTVTIPIGFGEELSIKIR